VKRKLKKVNALWPQTCPFDLEPSEKSQNKKLSDLNIQGVYFVENLMGNTSVTMCSTQKVVESGRKTTLKLTASNFGLIGAG